MTLAPACQVFARAPCTDGEVAHRAAADMTFGGPGASPQLRAELVSALERAAAKEAERLQRGGFATEAEGEVRLELVAAVGRLGDPSTIPLLADVLADFSRDYLADFGELALDDVLRVVQDPDSPDGAIREGLTALRFMVEDGSLRAASLDRVRTATRGHLERPRNFAVLGRAAQLGFVLGDSEFVALVESFAEDPEAIIALGITTARSIEHVQKRYMRALLDGKPPKPLREMRLYPRSFPGPGRGILRDAFVPPTGGGGVWESNPPTRVLAGRTGFEDQTEHQSRSAPAAVRSPWGFAASHQTRAPTPPGPPPGTKRCHHPAKTATPAPPSASPGAGRSRPDPRASARSVSVHPDALAA